MIPIASSARSLLLVGLALSCSLGCQETPQGPAAEEHANQEVASTSTSTSQEEADQTPDPTETQDSEEQPDIVLIALPGLRADHGKPFAEQAFIDGFGVHRSMGLTDAYAPSCSPFVSMGAMLTGLYASAIPLCSRVGGDAMLDAQEHSRWCSEIPDARHTIPKVLVAYGYRTHATVADAQGVDVNDLGQGVLAKGSLWRGLTQETLAWWTEADDPRFLLLVASDLHLIQYGPRYRGHLIDASGAPTNNEAGKRLGELRQTYRVLARELGGALGNLVETLKRQSDRPLWIIVTSFNGLNLAEAQEYRATTFDR